MRCKLPDPPASNEEDEYVPTTEEETSADELSDLHPIPPPPKPQPQPPVRMSKRRIPPFDVQKRQAAKRKALERLQSARKAGAIKTSTRGRRKKAPLPSASSSEEEVEEEDDDEASEDDEDSRKRITLDDIDDDSSSPSPSPSPPSKKRKRRAPPPPRRRNKRGSSSSFPGKPSQLVSGHRDYTSDRSVGSGEGLSDFIASEDTAELKEESEVDDDDDDDDDDDHKEDDAHHAEEEHANNKKKKGSNGIKIKKEENGSRTVAAAVKEEEDDGDDDGDEEEEQQQSKGKRHVKPAAVKVIISSSEEEEEDDVETLTAKAAEIRQKSAANENSNQRRRLRKKGDTAADISLPSPLYLADSELKQEEEDLPLVANVRKNTKKKTTPASTPQKQREIKKEEEEEEEEEQQQHQSPFALRARRLPPTLTAAQRIAQAQADFKSQQATIGVPIKKEEKEEEEEDGLFTDEGESSQSGDDDDDDVMNREGADMSSSEGDGTDDDVGVGKKAGLNAAERSPNWQKAVQAFGIGQSNDKECFYDYLEYMVMCYVDPTYRDRINESPEHKALFQHSVRRIETKMTAARDAVHSEAWRSCSRGLLEAVEWLPAAESGWNPRAPTTTYEDDMESWEDRCDACNRKKSHATRVIVFKGRPRPPPVDESWEDLPANVRYSVSFLAVSPVYIKKRQEAQAELRRHKRRLAGGQRGFQLGFTRGYHDDDATHRSNSGGGDVDYDEDDPLASFIHRYHQKEQQEQHEDDDEEEMSDDSPKKEDTMQPFDPEKEIHPPGEFMRKPFRVGRHCSGRLMLYHGMFHWKHRLLARLKKELKKEIKKQRRAGESLDPGTIADRVLAREDLKSALWTNFQNLVDIGQDYQLAGGEKLWKSGRQDPHTIIIEILSDLHAASDGEESDTVFDEEEEEGNDDDDGGGGRQQQQQQQQGRDHDDDGDGGATRRPSALGLRQVDIRKFF